jgi:hypothetical protein
MDTQKQIICGICIGLAFIVIFSVMNNKEEFRGGSGGGGRAGGFGGGSRAGGFGGGSRAGGFGGGSRAGGFGRGSRAGGFGRGFSGRFGGRGSRGFGRHGGRWGRHGRWGPGRWGSWDVVNPGYGWGWPYYYGAYDYGLDNSNWPYISNPNDTYSNSILNPQNQKNTCWRRIEALEALGEFDGSNQKWMTYAQQNGLKRFLLPKENSSYILVDNTGSVNCDLTNIDLDKFYDIAL